MKRALGVILLFLLVGAGIFFLSQEAGDVEMEDEEVPLAESGPSLTEYVEPSEAVIQDIINRVLSEKYDKATARHEVVNLNNDTQPEIVITAIEQLAEPFSRPSSALIQVVSVLDREGEYESMGKLEYQELLLGVPIVKGSRDIDGDGSPEFIVSLMFGGASSEAEGIVDIDFLNKKLSWAQLKDEEGRMQDAIFFLAATVAHRNYFDIVDSDQDGNQEIIEVFAQTLPGDPGFSCDAVVYEWSGNAFVYSDTLSQQALSQLDSECRMK